MDDSDRNVAIITENYRMLHIKDVDVEKYQMNVEMNVLSDSKLTEKSFDKENEEAKKSLEYFYCLTK